MQEMEAKSPDKKKPDPEDIHLRQEIYRRDVEKMADWVEDDSVVRYLNEEQNIREQLQKVLDQSSLPIFSHRFNRNGSFFMITLDQSGPIGFLRLVPKKEGAEIVVVIGERSEWGNGYGFLAVEKGVHHAFFNWREEKVIAKIRQANHRSKHVFRKVGFTKEDQTQTEEKYTLEIDDYL